VSGFRAKEQRLVSLTQVILHNEGETLEFLDQNPSCPYKEHTNINFDLIEKIIGNGTSECDKFSSDLYCGGILCILLVSVL
jgi:hypothetical protein